VIQINVLSVKVKNDFLLIVAVHTCFILFFSPSLIRYLLFDTFLDFLADFSLEKLGQCCVIVLDIPVITVVNFVKPH
jgi:hypothetical protein